MSRGGNRSDGLSLFVRRAGLIFYCSGSDRPFKNIMAVFPARRNGRSETNKSAFWPSNMKTVFLSLALYELQDNK